MKTMTDSRTKPSEAERLFALTAHERPLWARGLLVAGMDEVGRGPLAGPVAAACVIMPAEPLIEGVNDSKKLSRKRLELLHERIMSSALAVGIGFVDEKTIDEINILNATKRAMELAYEKLGREADVLLVDAVKGLQLGAEQRALVHGDAVSYSIAAASIVAKVERDRLMVKMAEKYPGYGFERNVGYGTKQHIDALKTLGACPIHRRSFLKNLAHELPQSGGK